MSDLSSPDTLHRLLGEVTETLPSLAPLPEHLVSRARRRRRARLAGSGITLAVVATVAGLVVAHAQPTGHATLRSRVAHRGSASTTAPHHRRAAVPTLTPMPGRTQATSSTPGACQANELTIALGMAGGTAGSTYYPLQFTNHGAGPCQLYGYPGVSYVSASGAQLGAAASRDPGQQVSTVTLAPGRTAAALVQETDVQNYPSSRCGPTMAAGLRVYAPGSPRALSLSQRTQACTSDVHQLTVGPVVANATGQ